LSGSGGHGRIGGAFDGEYDGRRVLVTGHTGFKGGWLCRWLRELGATVSGLALEPPTRPNLFENIGVDRACSSTIGDVRDAVTVQRVVDEHQPEVIFHLAAQPIVRRSWEEPRETLETNVVGTINVLDAAVRSPSTQAVVVVTSDKCYENHGWAWPYREADALGGHDPYSASKAAAEMVVRAYRRPELLGAHRSTPKVVSVRAGNVIGGGDWSVDRLVPDAARALTDDHDLVLRNPSSVRPWQHVVEALSGYLWVGARAVAEPGTVGESYNFGPAERGGDRSAREVAELAFAAWGPHCSRIRSAGADTEGREDGVLRLDVTLAREHLGWRPVWDVARSVGETMRWYRTCAQAHGDVDELTQLTLDQLAAYTRDAAEAGVAWAEQSRDDDLPDDELVATA
jgi:CDP-glucose 4,6-dehydratase